MNILIIGNGGREYSLALALRKDTRIKDIYFSPLNPAAKLFLNAKEFLYTDENLLKGIKESKINLVIIGPELPLIEGLSDFLRSNNIPTFAPSMKHAMLEGSKAYMKDFISKLNIPTAKYKEINLKNIVEGLNFIDSLNLPIVLKASGLCSGKGVLIINSKQEAKEKLQDMLNGKSFGQAGEVVVIEEFLDGYELSIFAVSNGSDYIILPAVQDHKKLLDNDQGPNTGGMGAYTNLPAHLYNDELKNKIDSLIIQPTMKALKEEGEGYEGVLFAGIMVCNGEPLLLEYNTRFGDPECEVLLQNIDTPLLDLVLSVVNHSPLNISINNESFVGVVLTSDDYARDTKSAHYPAKITLKDFNESLGYISFASVSLKESVIFANSGRVAICVGRGKDLKTARDNAYKIAECIEFEGKYYRKDIAYRALD